MNTEIRPAHSPLGASGAERWMNCPGSVALLKDLHIEEDSDEPEYRSLGTSAHKLADECLKTSRDAWELINVEMGKHPVDGPMSSAVQVYLDEIARIKAENPGGKEYHEYGIDAPDFHPDFYGTLDWGYVVGSKMWIRDYKHGEGVAVEVEDNPQIMYYAFGLLRHHPEVATVDLGIVQPRKDPSDAEKLIHLRAGRVVVATGAGRSSSSSTARCARRGPTDTRWGSYSS